MRLSQACKNQWAHLMAEVMPQERVCCSSSAGLFDKPYSLAAWLQPCVPGLAHQSHPAWRHLNIRHVPILLSPPFRMHGLHVQASTGGECCPCRSETTLQQGAALQGDVYTSGVRTALHCAQGDARDWALMYTSVAVFVFMAMQMFRVYAYWYYAAGLRPLVQTFR